MRVFAVVISMVLLMGLTSQAQELDVSDVLAQVGGQGAETEVGLGVIRRPGGGGGGGGNRDMSMTYEFWASGSMRDDLGNLIQLESYHAAVAYDFPGMRVDFTPATEGAESQQYIQVVSGEFAWNERDEFGGGLVPGYGSAVPAMDTVTDRLITLWTLPIGLYKAAAAAGEQTQVAMEGESIVLTFPFVNAEPEETAHLVVGGLEGAVVKVTLNADYRPERAEFEYDGSAIVVTYEDYADWNEEDYKADIITPGRIVRTVDGETVLDITVDTTNTYNPYIIIPVPENVRAAAGQ